MALILALNPANSHTPTLSRLARELKGCELIGADSSPTAITAIRNRVPDMVLLPAKQARGQADLMAHLEKIPGGVLTLQLPPVDSADPVALARQIREMLTGTSESPGAAAAPPAPLSASPYLLAAANAAITWIRARRADWEQPYEPAAPAAAYATRLPADTQIASARQAHEPPEPEYYEPIPLSDEPDQLRAPVAFHEPDEPSVISRAAGVAAGVGGTVASWLPRIAALAVVIGIAAAAVSYWPRIRGSVMGTVEQLNRPSEPAPSPLPAETAKPAQSKPTVAPQAEPDPLAGVSGWVAVFAPFDITISEGGTGVQVDERGRAMLAPGRHRLRFQKVELGYDEIRTVTVRPADTTTINLSPQTTIAVTSNEPAQVLIDGTRAGDTPFEGKVNLGTHVVTVRTAGAERQITVQASSKPVQLEIDFSKP